MTARLSFGSWHPCRCPSQEAHVAGCWKMAALAAEQDPLACRALWDGDRPLAVGGVVQVAPGDGLCFAWVDPAAPRMIWRRVLPQLALGMDHCHTRDIRRIAALVVATHPQGVRLIRRLGFKFQGLEPGYAGSTDPMMLYTHCRPEFEEPALVRHQLNELELACFASWCPELEARA